MNRAVSFAVALLLACSAGALDGRIGRTSTASLNISLTIPRYAKINPIGASVSEGALFASTGTEAVCVISNALASGYHLTASGSGQNGEFTVTDGEREMPYEVELNSDGGLCAGQSVKINFQDRKLLAFADGVYTGSLTVLISPE